MSMAINGVGNMCPCISCQRALTRTPAQKVLAKRAKIYRHFLEQMERIHG